MPITRKQLVDDVADLGSPLGPLGDYDAHEKRLSQWVDGVQGDWVGPLLQLLFSPPSLFHEPWLADKWEWLVVLGLTSAGRRDPEELYRLIRPHLLEEGYRDTFLAILSETRHPEFVRSLRESLASRELVEDELLGAIDLLEIADTDEARRMLQNLGLAIPPHMSRAVKAVREACRRKPGPRRRQCGWGPSNLLTW